MPTPPKKTVQRMTAWSFSRFNDWKRCAKLAYFKHVLRMQEPGNAAMERGGAIGELAEKFAAPGGKRMKTPPELQTFEVEFRDLQKRKVLSEEEWAYTSAWEPTGWFDKDAWCRVKVDAYHVMQHKTHGLLGTVIDYKTGKVRDYHLEQLSLYALAALLRYPELKAVEVQLWYLDQGVQLPEAPKVYPASDLPKLKAEWEKATAPMLRDTRFQEKPSKACTWCHFRKANGGPCKY